MAREVMVRHIAIEREDQAGSMPLLQQSDNLVRNGVGSGCHQVGLSFNEARRLREADMGAVKNVLATLGQILQKREFEGFSPVVFRDVGTHSEESFLHLLFWKSNLNGGVRAADYKTAGETVLGALEGWALEKGEKAGRVKMLLNLRDGQGRTVLHHATLKWGRKVVTRLLKLDADLCIGDVLGELPVGRISPSTLERFLDSKWHLRYKKVTKLKRLDQLAGVFRKKTTTKTPTRRSTPSPLTLLSSALKLTTVKSKSKLVFWPKWQNQSNTGIC